MITGADNFGQGLVTTAVYPTQRTCQIGPTRSSGTCPTPFFDFLGTAEADKKHFIAAGGHIIPIIDLTRETLDWFNQYLGEVR